MIALAEYNKDPWDIGQSKITFAELFELWKEKKAVKLGLSNRNGLVSAYRHCKKLQDVKFKAIRSFDMQECIDNSGVGHSVQSSIKNLFRHLSMFAIELDITYRSYAEMLTIEPAPESTKQPFTHEEIQKVWAFADDPWADSVLVFLYTGFRISELLGLKTADIDLKEGTMKGGVKTRAGKNRVVPIHSKILSIVAKRVKDGDGGEYLFGNRGKRISTDP